MAGPFKRQGVLRAWFAALCLTFAPVAADAAPEVASFTLKNGMQVVVIPDHRAPIVTHMVWYKVGSADEPRGKSGIAHFLEHLMFKRTRNLADGEFSKIVAENGGQHNAFTSWDVTAYYQDVAVDRLPLMMQIEADRMVNLRLKPEDIASERDVIIEERRLRIENNPGALLGEQMMAAMFLAHPYGIPIIGWLPEMQALDYRSTLDFYAAHYTPSNAILIVAGAVEPDEVRRLAERTYGKIRGRKVEPRVRQQEPVPVAARRVVLEDTRVRQPAWQRAYLAPSYRQAGEGTAEGLAVLAELLGSGTTSRLYKRLVIEGKMAAQAVAWYDGMAYDYGRFGIYVSPIPGGDADAVRARLEGIEREIDLLLADLLEHGITAEELERAKRRLLASEIYDRDSISALARIFGFALATGQTVEDVLSWPDRIAKVTAEQVMDAARAVINPPQSVTGLLLPKAEKAAADAPAADAPAVDADAQGEAAR